LPVGREEIEILGANPYQVELTPEHLHTLHAVIDDRLREWKTSA